MAYHAPTGTLALVVQKCATGREGVDYIRAIEQKGTMNEEPVNGGPVKDTIVVMSELTHEDIVHEVNTRNWSVTFIMECRAAGKSPYQYIIDVFKDNTIWLT